MITSQELRRKYIEFFKEKGHIEIPSASLIPENDPSVLFTTAGMQPLAPFLLGEKHPAGRRLVNVQKCVRTSDIEEVGDKYHHTFFEMLGHWSLGDPASPNGVGQGGYFKEEAVKMSWEFLTQDLQLDPGRLAFSVFKGDENASKDEEAASAWKKLGVKAERIAYLGKQENWWEPAGSSGPCGPCTEMFYWSDNKNPAPKNFDPKDASWVEIGNDVLMQYEKIGENKYQPSSQKNIDNGTGLERTLAVLNGYDDNYQTDLFWPIIEKIEELSEKKYSVKIPYGSSAETGANITRSMRIIADHLRAATFIMGDDLGIGPSNVDQGYVVRKLIRRAIRHGKLLGINEIFAFKIAEVVIKIMQDVYPELKKNKDFIIEQMVQEEEKFRKTLDKALKIFNTKIREPYMRKRGDLGIQRDLGKYKIPDVSEGYLPPILTGKFLFDMFQTYGFPLEMSLEELKRSDEDLSEYQVKKLTEEFNQEIKEHQELSRRSSMGKFKGGLSDQSEQVIKYHTATHLLHAALRQVLGEHIKQKGSNITQERLRFDFSHSEKMTPEQIHRVEDLVNQQIKKDLPISFKEMSVEEAKKQGAIGLFESKYGSRVKVYTIGSENSPFSREICGGPHVPHIGVLGQFKIIKEEAVSAGVRRIKAVLE